AGHETGYLLDASGAIKEALLSTSIPLGIRANMDFPSSSPIPLQTGDLVFLLTDGIPEACSPDGLPFGPEQPVKLVQSCRQPTAQQMVKQLYEAVRTFSKNGRQEDDITATVLKVTPAAETSGARS